MPKPGRVGIMGAIPEEIDALQVEMSAEQIVHRGKRDYHLGELWGSPCVLVYSRIGKVAAASTATDLIATFDVDRILFTGVAGGVDRTLRIGDIVVGTSLIQHDMDCSPLFKRHEIPLLGITDFMADPADSGRLVRAAREFLEKDFDASIPTELRAEFGLENPKVVEGEIASGDKFFAELQSLRKLKMRRPGVLCVEMEGAAVAQVCHEYGVPFSIIRTISDGADELASINFPKFIQQVSSLYSHAIIRRYFSQS